MNKNISMTKSTFNPLKLEDKYITSPESKPKDLSRLALTADKRLGSNTHIFDS